MAVQKRPLSPARPVIRPAPARLVREADDRDGAERVPAATRPVLLGRAGQLGDWLAAQRFPDGWTVRWRRSLRQPEMLISSDAPYAFGIDVSLFAAPADTRRGGKATNAALQIRGNDPDALLDGIALLFTDIGFVSDTASAPAPNRAAGHGVRAITPDREPALVAVTRLEWLSAQRADVSRQRDGFRRSASALDSLSGQIDAQRRLLAHAKPGERASIADALRQMESAQGAARTFRKQDADAAGRIAALDRAVDSLSPAERTAPARDTRGRPLVRVNPTLLTATRPRDTVRFLTVTWQMGAPPKPGRDNAGNNYRDTFLACWSGLKVDDLARLLGKN